MMSNTKITIATINYEISLDSAKLAIVKVQDGVGSSETALRTDSAAESSGYGKALIF